MANTVSLVSGACKYIHTHRLQVMCTAGRVFTRCRKNSAREQKNTTWQLLLFKSCSLLCRALTSRSKKKLPRQAHKHPPTVFHYKPVCTIYEKHLSSWCRVNTRVTACAWVPVWMKDGADRLASQSEAVLFCCASSISTLHHKKMLTHTYEIHTNTHRCVVRSYPVWQSNSRGTISVPLSPLLGCSRASASPTVRSIIWQIDKNGCDKDE